MNFFKELRANATLTSVAEAASRALTRARRELREYHTNITANYRPGIIIPYEVDCTLRRLAAEVDKANDLAGHLNRIAGTKPTTPRETKDPKGPDWMARFFALKQAVQLLSETAVYSPAESCQIPRGEAWDHLEMCASRYAQPGRTPAIKIPAALLDNEQED